MYFRAESEIILHYKAAAVDSMPYVGDMKPRMVYSRHAR